MLSEGTYVPRASDEVIMCTALTTTKLSSGNGPGVYSTVPWRRRRGIEQGAFLHALHDGDYTGTECSVEGRNMAKNGRRLRKGLEMKPSKQRETFAAT